jgi:hypothetical protein
MNAKKLFLCMCSALVLTGGCGSQKMAPHLGFGNFGINTEFSRDDIVVLDRVQGSSTTESICLGLIQIVDGDGLIIVGIPFFEGKYSSLCNKGIWMNLTEQRAYYKALEAAPDADAVFYKSMDYEVSGIPLIWWTETATYTGKGIKLKAD